MEYNSHRVLGNTAWNALSYGWPIVFSIFITPVIVNTLGIKEYGIYVFFSTIISILGLMDLGISTAVTKFLSEYYPQGDKKRIQKLLGTAMTIFSIVAVTGFLVCLIGALIPSLSNTFSDYTIYQTGIIFAGITFAITAINSVYAITFTALQRFDLSSKLGIIILTTQQISILLLVFSGYSVNQIFIVQAVIAAVTFFTQKYFATRILPNMPNMLSWDSTEARLCYRFGLVTFINNTATTSLTYLDRLIIPFFLGPSNLTYYSLPGNITSRIPGISNSLTAILFPMTSSLSSVGDTERIKNLYVRSFRLITVLAAAITVTTVAYAYQLLQFWISTDIANKATYVLIILSFTGFGLALVGPMSNFLLGLGKLRFLTTLSILMATLNTVLLVILLPITGINGAAWAYLLSLIPAVYMFYYTEKHYLSLIERKKYYKKIILGNIIVGSIVYLIAKMLLIHLITSLALVILIGGMTVLLYIVLYRLFGLFEQEDIDSIKLFLGRIAKRT